MKTHIINENILGTIQFMQETRELLLLGEYPALLNLKAKTIYSGQKKKKKKNNNKFFLFIEI